jgi:flagellar motor component MotA
MAMDTNQALNITLTPTILTVMRSVPVDEIDRALRKDFPNLFQDKQEKANNNLDLIEKIQNFVPVKGILGVEEAIKQTREANFLSGEPH